MCRMYVCVGGGMGGGGGGGETNWKVPFCLAVFLSVFMHVCVYVYRKQLVV